ncbi:response regulator [Salinispora oceanensis]|uniref:response regulator n=1 Tax=Salinispora oceanensis TaxID=1050199 RepID=UPI0003727E5B|nr:response regulator transcription factor [Salinispora oceanensis]
MISVLLVDDHPVVRAGVRGMLDGEPDITIVGEAGSGAEAITSVRTLHPDVVLMDLRLPGLDGVGATGQLRTVAPDTRVLVLTTYESDADVLRAVEAGATGYLLKDSSRTEMLGAIRAAARGETVLSPTVATRVLNRVRHPKRDVLSPREADVLRLVAAGMSNPDIAQALTIAEATVKTHLLRAFAKLDVSDRTAAVTKAMSLGLIPPDAGT